MNRRFQELDWCSTPLGELSLRRRWDATVDRDVLEIKLDDEFLMSSLFTVAETELARRALAELPGGDLDVLVGGLGLGYTAQAVLADPRVRSLSVVKALDVVIEWHENELIPTEPPLVSDRRCRFVHGDFFAMLRSPEGLDPTAPWRQFHAIVVDIDHSPRHVLDPSHREFYEPAGLRRLAEYLCPNGVFGLWSNDPPDQGFLTALDSVFAQARAEVVTFANPLQNRDATATLYLATARPES
ncbi:spermidine synthase [Prauserella flavalba]|uniref:Spermidine synthase n=1 Tax=Prauserella flavalba TaxID=1477506 RepID=A0A318L8T9_9PSEU|nr:spermidine synthase [Prauserella flavalba]PXY17048.1 spermidine synthase [Prauserella flavalba]